MESVDPITLTLITSTLMGGMIGKSIYEGTKGPPKMPKPGLDPAEAARASAEAMALRRRRGRASTILTGPEVSQTLGTANQGSKQLLGL